MITGEVKFDTAAFDQAIAAYSAGTRKGPGEVLRYWGPTLLRTVVLLTPPFEDKNALREVDRLKRDPDTGQKLTVKEIASESWNVQKKAGERALERDIRRLFKPNEWAKIVRSPKLQKRVREIVRRQEWESLMELLKNMRFGFVDPNHFIDAPTKEIHQRHRDRRGRVYRKIFGGPYYITKPSNITAYINSRKANIGIAKGGWVSGAQAKGFPSWITRHARGAYDDHSNDAVPYIRIGNNVDYMTAINADRHIVNRAMDQMAGKLTRALEGYLASEAKKAKLTR